MIPHRITLTAGRNAKQPVQTPFRLKLMHQQGQETIHTRSMGYKRCIITDIFTKCYYETLPKLGSSLNFTVSLINHTV